MSQRRGLWLSAANAPALGDVRAAGADHIFFLKPGVTERSDWGRYQDAIAQAVSRGAEVIWLSPVLESLKGER